MKIRSIFLLLLLFAVAVSHNTFGMTDTKADNQSEIVVDLDINDIDALVSMAVYANELDQVFKLSDGFLVALPSDFIQFDKSPPITKLKSSVINNKNQLFRKARDSI